MYEIPMLLLGVGHVGRALLRRIIESRQTVERRSGLRLNVVGLADKNGMIFRADGLSDDSLLDIVQSLATADSLADLPGCQPKPDNHVALDNALAVSPSPPLVVDASTADGERMRQVLSRALDLDCPLVMSNNRTLAGPWTACRRFFESRRVRFDVAVGGGLPMVNILLGLLDTGDSISSLEGSLSGTTSYICSQLQLNIPFSTALAEARKLGYTEPDPREDLSGMDSARKVLILGRLSGWPLEMRDVQIEGLFPPELVELSLDEFDQAVTQLDEVLAQRVQVARGESKVLRYVAEVNQGSGVVGLRAVPRASQLGVLQGPECLLTYFSTRYTVSPLTVAGRGVGAEMAGAGLLADILKLADKVACEGD